MAIDWTVTSPGGAPFIGSMRRGAEILEGQVAATVNMDLAGTRVLAWARWATDNFEVGAERIRDLKAGRNFKMFIPTIKAGRLGDEGVMNMTAPGILTPSQMTSTVQNPEYGMLVPFAAVNLNRLVGDEVGVEDARYCSKYVLVMSETCEPVSSNPFSSRSCVLSWMVGHFPIAGSSEPVAGAPTLWLNGVGGWRFPRFGVVQLSSLTAVLGLCVGPVAAGGGMGLWMLAGHVYKAVALDDVEGAWGDEAQDTEVATGESTYDLDSAGGGYNLVAAGVDNPA